MGTTTLLLAISFLTPSHTLTTGEVEELNSTFQSMWGTELVWRFDDLPTKGNTPKHRVPYSGYYYPDREGGTAYALRKYDQAFNRGRPAASSHERWDTTSFKERIPGLLGALGLKETPDWYGHCNGWASAAIRHAEPRSSVTHNGVTFSPSDIKALLAEIYVYNQHIMLGGANEEPITAAELHVILTNWLGRKKHPLGMEVDPSEEKWNYPLFAYSAAFAKHSERRVEVNMNVAYAENSGREWDESPKIKEIKFFHYLLDLNEKGEIVRGRFYRDSDKIDMLWVPLRPKASGTEGNERGNPYVNVDTVLAIWRASVPEDIRRRWVNIDPIAEDDFSGDPVYDETDSPVVAQEEAEDVTPEPSRPSEMSSGSEPFSVTEVAEDPVDEFLDLVKDQPADAESE